MEFGVGIVILVEVLAALGVIFGFLHEDVFIDFEKRFPQNVKDYIRWHKREFKRFLQKRGVIR